MSVFGDILSRGLRVLEDRHEENHAPPLLVWKGKSYPCLANSLTYRRDLAPGGFERDTDLVIFVRRNSFLAPITADSDLITVDSDTITVDHSSEGLEFGDELTVDSTTVTVDSTIVTVDSDLKTPRPGDRVTYNNRAYRVVDRRDLFGLFRFDLEEVDR